MEKGFARLKVRNKLKKIRKKRALSVVLAVVILVLLINIIASFSSYKTITVTINEGASSTKIAQILKDEGVISSKTWFLARLQLSKYRGKLQYGTFKFDSNASIGEIIETLATKGAKKNTVTLTIPEGYSVERIKARVVKMGLCTDSEFEEALNSKYDYDFLKAVPSKKGINYSLQGFLYPSTYEFYADSSATDIIKTMLSEFEKRVTALGIPNDKLYSVITKASMIEREAKIKSECPIIAGVIENRLKQNMPLQLDATVVYAISDGMYDVERVFYKDLEISSRYNTYKYEGLPIGPICSPGLVAIEAAYNPSKHDYLYYHTDTEKNDGSHIFTRTYSEHTRTMK